MEQEIASIAQQVLEGLLRQKAIRTDMRVLVVEDDEHDSFLAERSLRSVGLKVDISATAEDALRKLAAATDPGHRYVLVFLDLKLPDMDGIYVLKHVKQERPDLPVVIMTGQEINSELVRRAVNVGYFGFVKKPGSGEGELDPKEVLAKHGLSLLKVKPEENGTISRHDGGAIAK